MKMKDANKNEVQLFRTAMKNQYIFERLVAEKNGELMRQFLSVRNVYFPVESGGEQKFNSMAQRWDLPTVFKYGKELISIARKEIARLNEGKRANFLREIDLLITKSDLGKEWRETFATYIVIGILCPPSLNFYLNKDSKQLSSDELTAGMIYGTIPVWQDRVTIELNPDTSIEDLKNTMSEIEALTQLRWPNYRKSYLTKNSFTKLHGAVKTKWEKEVDLKNRKAEGYEEILSKQLSTVKAKTAILAHRKGMKEEEKQIGPIKRYIAYQRKLTDVDIAKKRGFRGIAQKKEVNRIRQDRKRQKMTIR